MNSRTVNNFCLMFQGKFITFISVYDVAADDDDDDDTLLSVDC